MTESELYQRLEIHQFATPQDWLNWLAERHGQSEAIWIRFARQGSGLPSINYEEAREGALRYGWIDGQSKSLDEHYYLRKFSPRRPRSKWSQVNREIAEQLMAQGLMFESGLAQVRAAQADGRWEAAYAPPSKITTPDDFQQLLDQHPPAAKVYARLKQMERFRILYRLQDAKRPETREKRKRQFLDELLQRAAAEPAG
jgi:uncharacterized protein YdeI (YjbR/CyaY-like superfamily)